MHLLHSMTIDNFLQEIDAAQEDAYREIPLFNPEQVRRWTTDQRQYFVKVFYHTRGHFDRLLWTRFVYAPDAEAKKQILRYMAEEGGLSDLSASVSQSSHELLFARFAEELGAPLTSEVTEQEGYVPFARRFNQGLIKWFREHDWETGQVGFAAYERLDNVDYKYMYDVAIALGVSDAALEFFRVHREADHFEKSSTMLPGVWQRDPKKVQEAFSFIYTHQRTMWQGLSDAVFDHKPQATND